MNTQFSFESIKEQALDELNLGYFSKPDNWDELVQKRIYNLTVKRIQTMITTAYFDTHPDDSASVCLLELNNKINSQFQG